MNSLHNAVFTKSNLCVIGNINRDIRVAPLAPGDYLFGDGETSASSIIETIGGGGANSACAAAALGARVAFIGKVGADALGDRLEQTLVRHSICSHLARDQAHPTGTSINLTFDNGHRHFISSLPNNESISLPELDLTALPSFTHLLRADIWFSKSMLFGGNEQLFRRARNSGLAVSIDLNWDPRWGVASAEEVCARKNAVRATLTHVNLVHGNIRELNEFADSTDLETTLGRLEQWGVSAVVVHMGSDGAGYYHQGQLLVEPPAPVEQRVNTTGTGDVLSVCMMLLAHQSEVSIPQQLKVANRIVAEFIEGKRQLIPEL